MTQKLIITLAQLRTACRSQRDRFEELFGDSVEITEALAVHHASDFDWEWAAENLFTDEARAEYGRVIASARAEYDRVIASARAEYGRVIASARAEYDRVAASAWAEFDRVAASAWARIALNGGLRHPSAVPQEKAAR
jgi:cell division septum initiation protein DivIVA